MSSEEAIYRSSYEELRQTMENQREAYERINQLAVDLAKIDLLMVSAVLAGVSVSGLSLSLPLVAGLLTYCYTLWCCIRVYEPRSFARGLGTEAIEEIDEAAQRGREAEEHYRELMFSYGEAISYLATAHYSVRATFRNALWVSVTAILLFSFVVVRQFLPRYPPLLDVAAVIIVLVVASWGKNKYEESEL